MDENNTYINKSEKEALEIMENVSDITSDQLQALRENEECFQTCSDIAEAVIGMQMEKNALSINTQQALADFHRKHLDRRNKKLYILWTSVAGVAATIIIILVLRMMSFSPESDIESIKVFQADHAPQQVKVSEYTGIIKNKKIRNKKVQIHRLSIPRGETFKVVLSDGTEVLLNSDSRLSYPTVFKGKERVVSLEGEAYFNVTKNTEHPFIVKSGNVQVRVLGTEFNMCSYTPDNVRVTLIEGKVAVSDTCGLQTVEMKPGQSAQLVSDGTFAVDEVDTETFLYWKEGFFYFDDVALVDMMKEIGKWYNIDIEFRNSEIMNLRMHFLANRQQKVSDLIELLNRMERIHVYLEGESLIIE